MIHIEFCFFFQYPVIFFSDKTSSAKHIFRKYISHANQQANPTTKAKQFCNIQILYHIQYFQSKRATQVWLTVNTQISNRKKENKHFFWKIFIQSLFACVINMLFALFFSFIYLYSIFHVGLILYNFPISL